MGISSVKQAYQTSPVQQTPVQTPVQSDPAVRVPHGQSKDRLRQNLPAGWFNHGGHNGFVPAVIQQVQGGYLLTRA